MKKTIMIVFLFLGSVGLSQASVLDKIQTKYQKLTSFQASFTQTLTNAATKEQDVRKGKLYFQKPGLIRWQILTPDPEILIVGTKIVWDVFPQENIAYKYQRNQILTSKTMLKFISGQANLAQDFISQEQGQDKWGLKIKLIPKQPEPNLVLAYVWINPKTYFLNKVLLVDFFGNGNELTINQLKLNPQLPAQMFKFTPTPQIKIIDNTKKSF